MFKPDRAASLAFAESARISTVCAWDGNKPIASSLPFYSPQPTTARRKLFHVASQCAQGRGRHVVLADGGERR
jgi:transcriptional regulator